MEVSILPAKLVFEVVWMHRFSEPSPPIQGFSSESPSSFIEFSYKGERRSKLVEGAGFDKACCQEAVKGGALIALARLIAGAGLVPNMVT